MTFVTKHKKYLKTSALIWLVCIVAFVLAYFLVIGPQNHKSKSIEKQLAQSKEEYELARKAAQQETQDRMNNEIELLQNKLNGFVIDYKGAEDLTFEISRIAEESKIPFVNIESGDIRASAAETTESNIFEKHIRISFVSGFKEFAMFLNALERHQPVLFINEFSLSFHNKDKTAYQIVLDVAALVKKPQDTTVARNPEQLSADAEL